MPVSMGSKERDGAVTVEVEDGVAAAQLRVELPPPGVVC